MKRRSFAIVARAADMSFWLLLAVNILFFLTFLAVLTFATGEARAAEPARCGGDNIVAQMAKDDPPLLAKIRAEAAATPNGEGLLWEIRKDGAEPSFLFGTMHLTDPRVVTLPEGPRKAFEQSGTVVIETTDVLDQGSMAKTMLAHPDLMMFTDGKTLTQFLSPEETKTVNDALKERGISLASVQKMKPWMLISLVALPACELARKSAGLPVLDINLARKAKAEGKEIAGLETAAEQFQAMASVPMKTHIQGLVDTIRLGDRIDDFIETLTVLYTKGETGMMMPFFNAALPGQGKDDSGYAEFEKAVVKARNRRMAERAAPFIDKGGAFIAVGALHLPGNEGLIELLRKAGYTVSPVH
jgi:uncharacterized protein YbaP (TraB family)